MSQSAISVERMQDKTSEKLRQLSHKTFQFQLQFQILKSVSNRNLFTDSWKHWTLKFCFNIQYMKTWFIGILWIFHKWKQNTNNKPINLVSIYFNRHTDKKSSNESRCCTRLVFPVGRQHWFGFVVASQSMNPWLNQNQAKLWIFVFPEIKIV